MINKQNKKISKIKIIIPLLIFLYIITVLNWPLKPLKPTLTTLQPVAITPSTINWPTKSSESAVGILNTQILETHGNQIQVPTASTAKLLTALAVLKIKPLKLGQQGPLITITAQDESIYKTYVAENGSVVPVVQGERISEYQMLQAMMLPSANNMADSLAIWAFGSLPAYTQYANHYAKQLGLYHTHAGSDASGYQPNSVSTAHDLVLLGEAAMNNPVLASIVNQKSASKIPVAGTINNINQLLGTDNIVGIKTGNSNQAGGVFISAAKVSINGQSKTIITASANAPDLYDAMVRSLPFIASTQHNFTQKQIISKNQKVGQYNLPWGGDVMVTSNQTISTDVWNGTELKPTVKLNNIKIQHSPQTVGNIYLNNPLSSGKQSFPLSINQNIPPPSSWWRITHPFDILF